MIYQLKIKILIWFLLIIVNCNGQQKVEKKEEQKSNHPTSNYPLKLKIKMKKLDIYEFNLSRKVIGEEGTELIKDDTVFQFIKEKGIIKRESFKRNENLKTIEIFEDKSFMLVFEVTSFFNFPINVSNRYDSMGNRIEEINYEKDYKVSIDDIITLAKSKFKVDISKKIPGLYVTRGKDDVLNRHVYTIFLPVESRTGRYIIIDAESKEIISDKIVTATD